MNSPWIYKCVVSYVCMIAEQAFEDANFRACCYFFIYLEAQIYR